MSNLRAGVRREYNVRDLIDERPLSRFQLLVLALCVFIVVMDGFDSSIGFLAPSIADDLRIPLPEFGPVYSASLVGLMIAVSTVLLWIPLFMNLLTIYFILSWLPGLLRQLGMPISAGVAAFSWFGVGGIIGSLIQGYLMAGGRGRRVLAIEFAVSAVLIALLAFAGDSYAQTLTLTTLLGISVQGAQAGLNGLAAEFYPTSIRATGVGWASGIGRIGSIIGPVLGGILISQQWEPREIFLASTLPALAASASFMRKNAG